MLKLLLSSLTDTFFNVEKVSVFFVLLPDFMPVQQTLFPLSSLFTKKKQYKIFGL